MTRGWTLVLVPLLVGACAARPSVVGTEAPSPAPGPEPTTPATDDVEASLPTPRPPRTVFRSEIDRALLGGPAYLLAQLGPEPFRLSGHVIGWQITRLFPDDPTLAAVCDLRPGDVVLSINGDPVATPDALTALLERLPGLDALVVVRLRDERKEEIRYALVEDRPAGPARDPNATTPR